MVSNRTVLPRTEPDDTDALKPDANRVTTEPNRLAPHGMGS